MSISFGHRNGKKWRADFAVPESLYIFEILVVRKLDLHYTLPNPKQDEPW